jgi:hypothetical protein
MIMRFLAVVLGAALLIPPCALAQTVATGDTRLEQTIKPAPPAVVKPTPPIGEAEKAVGDLESQQRREQLIRETATPPLPRRPEQDQDLKGGLQQKALEGVR